MKSDLIWALNRPVVLNLSWSGRLSGEVPKLSWMYRPSGEVFKEGQVTDPGQV